MRFRTVILLSGKSATGIEVPAEVVASLGSSKKPAVSVTIGDYTYRSTVATMDGKFMIPVSAAVRANTGVGAGDEVEVSLEIDASPREVNVPDDFAAALAGDNEAMRFFESLSYSNKRRIVIPIDEAKTPETRERRIAKAVEKLRENQL